MSNTTATATVARPTGRVAKIPTLYRLTDDRVILTDVPFMIVDHNGARMQSRRVLGGQGLGLQFRNHEHVSGWIADTRKLGREAVDALAAYDVAVVDLSGKKSPAVEAGAEVARQARPASGRASRPQASPVTVTRTTPRPTPSAGKAPRKGVSSGAIARNDLAAKITAALVGEGIEPEIIAEAIRAAVAKADERAKIATATVSTPTKAPRGTAAKAKARAPRGETVATGAVSANADGSRVVAVAAGVPVGAAATAIRKALGRAGFTGVSVRKSGRQLTAYRADGAPVAADVDSVIVAAIATVS